MTPRTPTTLIKRPEVRRRTTLSDSALYRLMEAGEFPRPIRPNPSGRAVAWVEADIEQWMSERIESARQQGALA